MSHPAQNEKMYRHNPIPKAYATRKVLLCVYNSGCFWGGIVCTWFVNRRSTRRDFYQAHPAWLKENFLPVARPWPVPHHHPRCLLVPQGLSLSLSLYSTKHLTYGILSNCSHTLRKQRLISPQTSKNVSYNIIEPKGVQYSSYGGIRKCGYVIHRSRRMTWNFERAYLIL